MENFPQESCIQLKYQCFYYYDVNLWHKLQFLGQYRIQLGHWAYTASFILQIYLYHIFSKFVTEIGT
jgi:hypothetical protein